jgi:hypothetical protein
MHAQKVEFLQGSSLKNACNESHLLRQIFVANWSQPRKWPALL